MCVVVAAERAFELSGRGDEEVRAEAHAPVVAEAAAERDARERGEVEDVGDGAGEELGARRVVEREAEAGERVVLEERRRRLHRAGVEEELSRERDVGLVEELEERVVDACAAAAVSRVNYSFYMGVSNDNLEEALRTDPRSVCGLKAFLGSSTGNMLVDDPATLDRLFRKAHMLLAIHAEDETTIRSNMAAAVAQWGEEIPMEEHPLIRSAEACYKSSSNAVKLAKEHGTRLHVLHISTAKEIDLFDQGPIDGKKITAEACVHHLWFTDEDYVSKGAFIKWNPAVKTKADRDAVRQAVIDDRIDVVATDHAPHTLEEKQQPYMKCPSGGPLIQHSLVAMMELADQGVFTLEQVVEKMCHAPARLFRIEKRGFIREDFQADLVLVDTEAPWTVSDQNILYKCRWSPFEGQQFKTRVLNTWVNGEMVFANGRVDHEVRGQRILFDR